jgi:hypothetical protein
MKAGGMEVYLHSFLNLVLHGIEWLASRPGRFTPGEEPREPIVWTAGRAPETVWVLWGRRQLQTAPSAMWRTGCRTSHGARVHDAHNKRTAFPAHIWMTRKC